MITLKKIAVENKRRTAKRIAEIFRGAAANNEEGLQESLSEIEGNSGSLTLVLERGPEPAAT